MRFAVNLKFFPHHWKLHDQTFYRWKALDRITTSSNISSVGRCHKYNSPVQSEITFLYRNIFVTFVCNGQHSLTFLTTFLIITRTLNCKSIFWLVRFLHEEFPREDWADHMIWCGNPLLLLFWVFLATVWECARLSVEKFGFFSRTISLLILSVTFISVHGSDGESFNFSGDLGEGAAMWILLAAI